MESYEKISGRLTKSIKRYKPKKDKLQKEKGRLEKELSKSRGVFGSDHSCNNLQQQLRMLNEKIKIHNKIISKASTLSDAEKSLFKKKRTKRRRGPSPKRKKS